MLRLILIHVSEMAPVIYHKHVFSNIIAPIITTYNKKLNVNHRHVSVTENQHDILAIANKYLPLS